MKDTVPGFLESKNPSPIGFISFDLDYYSSTMDAFRLIWSDQDHRHFLPRSHCYFDDIIGNVDASYNDFVGELAAIATFNADNSKVKIAESRVFRRYRKNFSWYHQIYLIHRFEHPMYDTYISPDSATSLALKA